MKNEDKLFREATLKICSSLEIDRALHELLLFLLGVMPLSRIYLQHYDDDYHAIRTIAYASQHEHGKLDLLTPLSEEARQKVTNTPQDRDAFLITDPKSFPVTREMTTFHGIASSSVIVMSLRSDKTMLGYLILVSEGDDILDENHRKFVELLKEPLVISMSNALQHREVVRLNDLLEDDNRYLHGELRRLSGDEIIGANFGLRKITNMIHQVATLDSPVLLMGETGTGKDVIANAIHYSSSRSDGPFVSVNCGAIPDSLVDSELFGHEKGAFTGALSQKRGRFERAHKGTIFLDEMGELPLQAQTRLLKVLQNKEVERVGGVSTITLDIRIIAATNRDLEKMVQQKEFREDLWFRLNVFPIHLPPLRKRTVDIPALIQHFINLKAKELKLSSIPTISSGAIETAMSYRWPGNVRELQNVIERALILNPQGPITFEHIERPAKEVEEQTQPLSENSYDLDEVTVKHINRVLELTEGKISGSNGAAKLLGINPSTLRNRMKKLGIQYGRTSNS